MTPYEAGFNAATQGANTTKGTTNAMLHGCSVEGWECFHCGELFTTVGGARDHFGACKDSEPGCYIKVKYGDEMGLLMELRKAEAENAELREALALFANKRNWAFPRKFGAWQFIGRAATVLPYRIAQKALYGRQEKKDESE